MSTANPIYIALVSLHPDWTEQQRKDNRLASRELALEMLIRYTGENYGYSIWRWSLHLLKHKRDLKGIWVLIGLFTGSLARQIKRTSEYVRQRNLLH